MTRKHLLRLAALAQGAAVISVAGCNQTPSVSAPTSDGPSAPPINAPAPLASTVTAADSADASSPDAATAYRPRPPYLNAPPRPLSSGFTP